MDNRNLEYGIMEHTHTYLFLLTKHPTYEQLCLQTHKESNGKHSSHSHTHIGQTANHTSAQCKTTQSYHSSTQLYSDAKPTDT